MKGRDGIGQRKQDTRRRETSTMQARNVTIAAARVITPASALRKARGKVGKAKEGKTEDKVIARAMGSRKEKEKAMKVKAQEKARATGRAT